MCIADLAHRWHTLFKFGPPDLRLIIVGKLRNLQRSGGPETIEGTA